AKVNMTCYRDRFWHGGAPCYRDASRWSTSCECRNLRSTLPFSLERGVRHRVRLALSGFQAAGTQGLDRLEMGVSEYNRRAKVYRLTRDGKKQLSKEHSEWNEFVRAVGRVMAPVRNVFSTCCLRADERKTAT